MSKPILISQEGEYLWSVRRGKTQLVRNFGTDKLRWASEKQITIDDCVCWCWDEMQGALVEAGILKMDEK